MELSGHLNDTTNHPLQMNANYVNIDELCKSKGKRSNVKDCKTVNG